jgi:hypothetical protein
MSHSATVKTFWSKIVGILPHSPFCGQVSLGAPFTHLPFILTLIIDAPSIRVVFNIWACRNLLNCNSSEVCTPNNPESTPSYPCENCPFKKGDTAILRHLQITCEVGVDVCRIREKQLSDEHHDT